MNSIFTFFINSKTAKANTFLALAAIIWGLTFIFQRTAMDHLSPLAYGGLRFLLGGLTLLPFACRKARQVLAVSDSRGQVVKWWLLGSMVSGLLLFSGITFQQYGLVETTAGKAGFITGLYVVLVPVLVRFAGQRIEFGVILGGFLGVGGLYLLSFTGSLNLAPGDGLVLFSTVLWAGHVIVIGWFSPKMDSLVLATGQALFCGALSLAGALLLNQWPSSAALAATWLDVIWGGLMSVAIGFTCQVIGQKNAPPAPAAIIMQMEAAVAALAGWLFLDESMTGRMLLGAFLMLSGMLISQLWPIWRRSRVSQAEKPTGRAR